MFNLPSEASVVSNVIPKHYGVSATQYDIDPIEDADEERFYSKYLDKDGVERMTWYIHQGDDRMRARPIEFDFFSTYDEDPSYETLQETIVLWECESLQAPRHPREGLITPNCTLKADLSGVPAEHFIKRSRRETDGKVFKWWDLHYKLVVTLQSGPMLFSISCHGKEYGSVATTY